jgi:hypothetical protein
MVAMKQVTRSILETIAIFVTALIIFKAKESVILRINEPTNQASALQV